MRFSLMSAKFFVFSRYISLWAYTLQNSLEIELVSYFLELELELICYGNWNQKQELELT